jgi:hypothetical protein
MIQLIRAFSALVCFGRTPSSERCERSHACAKADVGMLKSADKTRFGVLAGAAVIHHRPQTALFARMSLESFAKVLMDTISCGWLALKALFCGYGCYAHANDVIRKPGVFSADAKTPFHTVTFPRKRIAAYTLQSLMLGFPHFFSHEEDVEFK